MRRAQQDKRLNAGALSTSKVVDYLVLPLVAARVHLLDH